MQKFKRVTACVMAVLTAASMCVPAFGYSSGKAKPSLSKATVKFSKSTFTYNGKSQKPTVYVSYGSKKLKNGTDYKLTIKNNKKIGRATVTVSGKGRYTGSKTKSFVINPKKVTQLKAYPSETTVNLVWKNVTTCSGYKIYRYDSASKKWKTVKVISGKWNANYTDSGLSKGTVYRYKVAAYQRVGRTNFRGDCVSVTASTYGNNNDSSSQGGNDSSSVSTSSVYDSSSSQGSTSTSSVSESSSSASSSTAPVVSSSDPTTSSSKPDVSSSKPTTSSSKPDTSSSKPDTSSTSGTTPVAKNGRLKVSGANIVNENGNKFQIKGMSTHGIMWEDFSNILTKDSLKVLRDDWKVNTIRIAMYTEEWGGYCTGGNYASQAKAKVENGVKNATDLGMYAIIDWHVLSDQNPKKHQSEAVKFFDEMSKKYKGNKNVMYEICNEPNGSANWNNDIKPYAETVTKTIRANDKNAIIICGTDTWSQGIDKAAGNRLSDKNTVYALHFYANTHTDWLRNRFTDCYNKGLPILVSEFGTCDASGNGGFNASQSRTWLKLLDSKKVGYINWSACGKSETASAFKSGTNLSKISKGEGQLTESGKLVRKWYREGK